MTFSLKDNALSFRTTEWVETLRYLATGKCFSTRTFGAAGEMVYDMIQLNSSYGYRVYIHDPDVFFVSFNPSGLARIDIGIEKKLEKMAAQYLRATEHILLDRPSSPCQSDQQYSLISCIEMKIVQDSGCKVCNLKIIFSYFEKNFIYKRVINNYTGKMKTLHFPCIVCKVSLSLSILIFPQGEMDSEPRGCRPSFLSII